MDPYSADTILYLRAIQGRSGRKHISPTRRLRRAHLPRWKLPRSALDHSIRIDSGWRRRQERETCGVSPMFNDRHRERDYDVTKPMIAVYRTRDCSSIKHDPTPSSFKTLYLRCASKGGQSPTLPQIILLKPNQDTASSDARTSFDHSC